MENEASNEVQTKKRENVTICFILGELAVVKITIVKIVTSVAMLLPPGCTEA